MGKPTPSVGSRVNRADGLDKVTGRARYVDDLAPPGAIWGGTVRSDVPRGKIASIELDRDFDWSDIVVVDASDIPGRNVVPLIEEDQPVLAEREVRHRHEPVMLMACKDRFRLNEALRRVRILYERRPCIADVDEALEAKIKLFGDDNVFKEIRIEKGDLEAGFAAAAHVVEEIYEVGHQEQLYIEPQGMIGEVKDDGTVVVTGSMQCPYYVHRALKCVFGVKDDARVRVVQAETGGGFGGKEEYPNLLAAHAALLAWKAGRPVKMIYSRAEDMAATTKRHPAEIVFRAGVDEEGRLTAVDVDVVMDGGAYCTLTPVVLSRGVLHALSCYRCDNVGIRGRAVATHTPPNGAFRGFGAPQTVFACERHMDLLAQACGLTPLEIRRRNHLVDGDSTATGQVLAAGVSAGDVLARTIDAADYDRKHAEYSRPQAGPLRRGIGLSLYMHGCGFTGSGETMLSGRVTVRVQLDPSRPLGVRADVLTSSTEIGQGMRTIFRQIAADTLGLSYDDVTVPLPDTGVVPDSGPTVASRTCMVVGGVVEKAARACLDRLDGSERPLVERVMDYASTVGELEATAVYEAPPGVEWDESTYRGSAYPVYGYACDVVEVEIDTVSFEVRIVDVVTCQDVGRAIHPGIVEGQIEGGTVQALGYGYFESVVMRDGGMLNNRMTNYIIPTALDVPRMRVLLHEEPYGNGPFGAKGVGEMPMDGGAPPLIAAIGQALGLELKCAPVTPEMLAELDQARGGEA